MAVPTCNDIHRTMESALARGLEGVHELPEGVLLAGRDRNGRWGNAGAYYTYCLRCGVWLNFDQARSHMDCKGNWWDAELASAALQWQPQIERMAERVQRGEDPYFGLLDLRCNSDTGSLPALVPGRRQLVRLHCRALGDALEAVVDVPHI